MATLTRKPLSWFKLRPQVRKEFDEAELRSLGESLKIKQIQPVIAKSDGTVKVGGRRVHAGELVGLKELDVIISDEELTDSELRILQIMENIHRAGLSDGEMSSACEELALLNPGMTNKDLAAKLKISEATICKYRSASRCIPEVRQALETGHIGITTAYEISRVEPDKQLELLRLQQSGISRDGMAEHVRKQKKAATPEIRAKRISCPLPSGVCIAVTGKELSLDDLIEALAEAQKEARKAREQGLDARTFGAVMKDKAKKRA